LVQYLMDTTDMAAGATKLDHQEMTRVFIPSLPC
jgi:hypothetical protein